MRRTLLFSSSLALLALLAWWVLTPAPRELSFAHDTELYGFVDPANQRGRTTAESVLTLLAQLAPAAQRAQAKVQVKTPTEAREIRVAVGFKKPQWEWQTAPATATEGIRKIIPALSLQQLSALPNGYLLLRSENPVVIAEDARFRRWLGGAMSESLAEAKAVTITVGEDSVPASAIVGLCLEFAQPEQALAAVKRIAVPAANNVLTFNVSPQAEQVAKNYRLVVIRFQVDALYLRLAAQPR